MVASSSGWRDCSCCDFKWGWAWRFWLARLYGRQLFTQRFKKLLEHRREGKANRLLAGAAGVRDAAAAEDHAGRAWQTDMRSVWQLGCGSYPMSGPVFSAFREQFSRQGVRAIFEVVRRVSCMSLSSLPSDDAKMPALPAFDAAAFARRMPKGQRTTCMEMFGPDFCRSKDAAVLTQALACTRRNL